MEHMNAAAYRDLARRSQKSANVSGPHASIGETRVPRKPDRSAGDSSAAGRLGGRRKSLGHEIKTVVAEEHVLADEHCRRAEDATFGRGRRALFELGGIFRSRRALQKTSAVHVRLRQRADEL